jgi:hypothetical protein
MQKVIKKESLKFFKLFMVGLLLIIVLVLSGEELKGTEMLILGITPYILLQIYRAVHWRMRHKKK